LLHLIQCLLSKEGFFPLDWHSKFLNLQELSYHYPNNGLLANVGTYLAISYLLIDIFISLPVFPVHFK